MSKLLVFTTGTDLHLLRQSCADVMITLHTYDCIPWKGYVTGKVREAIKFLQTRREPIVMFVDGNDSLVIRPERDILARWEAYGYPLLISAEHTCWPNVELADKYPQAPTPRFINSGGWIGTMEQVLGALHTILRDAITEDDQGEWTRAYLAGVIPSLQIDHARQIFASVGDGMPGLSSDSCVKHWNGKVPGREDYYADLCYKRAKA